MLIKEENFLKKTFSFYFCLNLLSALRLIKSENEAGEGSLHSILKAKAVVKALRDVEHIQLAK